MVSKIGSKRKFGGKVYTQVYGAQHKGMSQKFAKKWRRTDNSNCRVVPEKIPKRQGGGTYWCVYQRKK
jgi:hypothetical protein